MELLAILIIVAIILAIIKVGSVLWRIIGVIFTIFLLWVFKDDLLNWGHWLIFEGGATEFLQQVWSFLVEVFNTLKNWLSDVL